MSLTRQTHLRLLFTASEKDVTESLLPDLLSFTYDDKESNEADEISITLKDPKGKWAGTWKPDGGEIIRAYIANGTVKRKGLELYCGRFYVDTLRASGSSSGRQCEIRAVSVPLNTPIRKKLKTKAWEKQTLKAIAQEIAKTADMKLLFDSQENPSFDRQDQSKESDLKFLSRLCEDSGLSLKVTDEKIVIFDQASFEKKKPIKTLVLGESNIISWDFESQQSETFKSCTVTYRNPKLKKQGSSGGFYMSDAEKAAYKKSKNQAVMTYTYIDPLVNENGQEFAIKKRASSIEDAKRLAKAQLRKLNARSVTGSMTVMGDVSLVAGVVITCKGFGSFDGNFIIEQATHSMSSSGYTTGLALRRVNNNY